jgi:SAM-dependent methyltransferase
MTFASIYHAHLNQALDEFYVALVKEVIPLSFHIIDAGCGHGKIAYLLSQLGYEVSGLDIDEEMLDIAKKQISLGLTYYHHDLLMPWPVFGDAVIMTQDVIHYFEDTKKLLEEALKSLAFEGILIIDMFKASINLNAMTQFQHPDVIYSRTSQKDIIEHRYETKEQTFEFKQFRHHPNDVKAFLTSYEFEVIEMPSIDKDKIILIATKY